MSQGFILQRLFVRFLLLLCLCLERGCLTESFSFQEEIQEPFQIIMVKVLTNWGHEDYTCLYRFRVHGKPIHDQD